MKALDGGDHQAKIQTGFTIITKDNMNTSGKDAIYKSSC